ncbi:unnamed protein product [Cylicostephanus goldi]|uniref:Carboxypeptidase n=1 Tax=Cylicostephanus goldi TaxID=71465 RepID=A0A3P6RPF4_CYLGO|nr:unnamed protein product [Cylicostephanus goldi]
MNVARSVDDNDLFLRYIESENDPSKDPVVLWLNGGPGCSSLEGLFMEMGPFRYFIPFSTCQALLYKRRQEDSKRSHILLLARFWMLGINLDIFRAENFGSTITRNKWTWNRVASIIYLDAPAGVGFSVNLNGSLVYTDDEVASDNYLAIIDWFKKFPDRRSNDFYVAGESYGGTYVPMLSALLVDDKENFPQFKVR